MDDLGVPLFSETSISAYPCNVGGIDIFFFLKSLSMICLFQNTLCGYFNEGSCNAMGTNCVATFPSRG